MTRFILEGIWTGYTSAQSRVCHREIINAERAERLRCLHKIVYTDGTALLIRIREAEYREKVIVRHQYNGLIRDAERRGGTVVLVSDLCEATS